MALFSFFKSEPTIEVTVIRTRRGDNDVRSRTYIDEPDRARVYANRQRERFGEKAVAVTTSTRKAV